MLRIVFKQRKPLFEISSAIFTDVENFFDVFFFALRMK